ncbi:MAG: ABC transporter substrate-binding protein [Acidimicrobiaceae bacterium]|nr:ABC transporter substrate-binding protein [Acidimicrobiaceae bacterium]
MVPFLGLLGLISSTITPSAASAASGPKHGGTLNVLETSTFLGAWPAGLYPPTDTSDAADFPYMDAIYGDLFEMGKGAKLIPDLATGYKFSKDAKTVTVTLRPGLKFSDGTPLNSAAVKWNWQADLKGNACACASSFPLKSISTPNPTTVVMHLTKPFSPILDLLPQNALDWMASPTAVKKMGAKAFALKPVGAGPFMVKSDSLNSKLVLVRNPNYWEKGKPYLDGITFSAVGNDNSAVDALQSKEQDVEQYFITYNLLKNVQQNLRAQQLVGTSVLDIQLNTSHAPFNNIDARKAVFYATDIPPIQKSLTSGVGLITQSPSVPGSVVYEPKVASYPSFDLAKAKALVKKLGGLHFTLYSNSGGAQLQVSEALVNEWKQAGIDAKLQPMSTLQAILNAFKANTFDGIVQGVGGLTPFLNNGGSLFWRVASNGPFTTVHDPKMDQLLTKATSSVNPETTANALKNVYSYLAQKAYLLLVYGQPYYNISQKNVHGPGIDTGQPFIYWQSVWKG